MSKWCLEGGLERLASSFETGLRQTQSLLRKSGFCVAICALTTSAQADTLIDNVNGITLDASGKVQRFKGLLIGNDGKIIRLLTGKEPPPPPRKKKDRSPYPPQPDFRLDGKGQTLMAGFIDGHGHAMKLGWQALNVETGEPAPLKPLSKDRDLAFVKAQESLLSHGITSIADMGTTAEDWNAFRRAGDRGALRIRIFSYAFGLEPMLAVAGGEPTPWLYDSKLRMVGVKFLADGALGSRGALLKEPYADAAGNRGISFVSDTALRNQMTRAAMDGFQIAVHATGDAGNAQVLDAIDELALTFTGDRRWRIEHAQVLSPSDIPRFARSGIIASMQPVHQTSDRTMAEARLGPARLSGAYAWKSILNAGGKLAFGSDLPVESPNVFAGLAAAITRENAKGEPFGGWQPQEKVTREEALAGFTTWAAYASFAEGKVGRLAPGLYADFIFLDRDPLLATPAELRATKVTETWVGGQKVYTAK